MSLYVLSLQDEIHILSAPADSSEALKNSSHILWIIHVVLHFTGILYQVTLYNTAATDAVVKSATVKEL